LSEKTDKLDEVGKRLRFAHIGIAVSVSILVLGFWPVRHSEDAVAVLGTVAFFAGLAVCLVLGLRYERNRDEYDS